MDSSPLGSEGKIGGREPLVSESPVGDPSPGDRQLLESVLELAETTLASDDPLAVADVEAVHEVVRRHPDVPFALEPIVVELVQALLQAHFCGNPDWLPTWNRASAVIAQTLFDDPVCHGRLESLWGRLLKGER